MAANKIQDVISGIANSMGNLLQRGKPEQGSANQKPTTKTPFDEKTIGGILGRLESGTRQGYQGPSESYANASPYANITDYTRETPGLGFSNKDNTGSLLGDYASQSQNQEKPEESNGSSYFDYLLERDHPTGRLDMMTPSSSVLNRGSENAGKRDFGTNMVDNRTSYNSRYDTLGDYKTLTGEGYFSNAENPANPNVLGGKSQPRYDTTSDFYRGSSGAEDQEVSDMQNALQGVNTTDPFGYTQTKPESEGKADSTEPTNEQWWGSTYSEDPEIQEMFNALNGDNGTPGDVNGSGGGSETGKTGESESRYSNADPMLLLNDQSVADQEQDYLQNHLNGRYDTWQDFQFNGTKEEWEQAAQDLASLAWINARYDTFDDYWNSAMAFDPYSSLQLGGMDDDTLRRYQEFMGTVSPDWTSMADYLADNGYVQYFNGSDDQEATTEALNWLENAANSGIMGVDDLGFYRSIGDEDGAYTRNELLNDLMTYDLMAASALGQPSGITESDINYIMDNLGSDTRFTTNADLIGPEAAEAGSVYRGIPEGYSMMYPGVQQMYDAYALDDPYRLTGSFVHQYNPNYMWYMEGGQQ